jgi:hypothetical protein
MKQNLEDEVSRSSHRDAEEDGEGDPFPLHDTEKKEKEQQGDGDKPDAFHEKGIKEDGSAHKGNFQEVYRAKNGLRGERLSPSVGPRPLEDDKREDRHQDACPEKQEPRARSSQGAQPHSVGFQSDEKAKDEPEGAAYPVRFTHSSASRETGVSKVTKFDALVKSLQIVMPDLIRHPEHIELTGFRLSPE